MTNKTSIGCYSFAPFSIILISFGFLTISFLEIYYYGLGLHLHTVSSLIAFVLAYGLLMIKPWAFIGFHTYSAFLVASNLYTLYQYSTKYYFITFVLLIAWIAFSSFFVQKHIDSPYFNPIKTFATRYLINLPVFIRQGERFFSAELTDISSTGCFIRCDKEIKLGSLVHLEINNDDFELRAKLQVMRFSELAKGYGLRFEGIDHRVHKDCDHAVDCLLKFILNSKHKKSKQVS